MMGVPVLNALSAHLVLWAAWLFLEATTGLVGNDALAVDTA